MAKPDKIVSVKSDQISSLKLLGLLNISIHKQHPFAKGFFFHSAIAFVKHEIRDYEYWNTLNLFDKLKEEW